MAQFITIRFLHFSGFSDKKSAFAEMGKSLNENWYANGLTFSKHLGCGAGNGFSVWPDFSLYAWIGVWEREEQALCFFENDARWLNFVSASTKVNGWNAEPLKGHGTWNGLQPFYFSEADTDWNGKIAVITRASIRPSQALRFWWNVPGASRHIIGKKGLVFAKGIGEFPLIEQATLSVWESASDLDQFAYKSREHAPMIKKTRKFNWYKEEMFVRLKIVNEF